MRENHFSTSSTFLVLILTLGVFSIINTEMGVVGVIPLIAEEFHVTVPQAGWVVSVFALTIAISAPVLPLLFSRMNKKYAMVLTLGLFTVSNIIAMLTDNFTVLLVCRILPAFLHPVYVAMAFSVAASSVCVKEAPKAISRVFIGVSAGMVLGVPVTSFIASNTSLSMAMLFFVLLNAAVLLATILFVPSLPVSKHLSYGSQLAVLKKNILWYSVISAILINGAIFGFFSYMADFFQEVTQLPYNTISLLLFEYGMANIIGNILAGKMLVKKPTASIIAVPFALLIVYVALYFFSTNFTVTIVIILLLGILAGVAANNMQYMITQSALEVPEFANGLFIASANLGTMLGTAISGMIITVYGSNASVFGALLFLVLSFGFVFLRVKKYHILNGDRS